MSKKGSVTKWQIPTGEYEHTARGSGTTSVIAGKETNNTSACTHKNKSYSYVAKTAG